MNFFENIAVEAAKFAAGLLDYQSLRERFSVVRNVEISANWLV